MREKKTLGSNKVLFYTKFFQRRLFSNKRACSPQAHAPPPPPSQETNYFLVAVYWDFGEKIFGWNKVPLLKFPRKKYMGFNIIEKRGPQDQSALDVY